MKWDSPFLQWRDSAGVLTARLARHRPGAGDVAGGSRAKDWRGDLGSSRGATFTLDMSLLRVSTPGFVREDRKTWGQCVNGGSAKGNCNFRVLEDQ